MKTNKPVTSFDIFNLKAKSYNEKGTNNFFKEGKKLQKFN